MLYEPTLTFGMKADDYMKEPSDPTIKNYMFLSREWIARAVSEIEKAKAINEDLRKRLSDVNFRIAYRVIGIPPTVAELYGSEQVVAYFKIDHGVLKDFLITNEAPKDVNITVTAEYAVVKKIFEEELDPSPPLLISW
jgi:hypothetical protein